MQALLANADIPIDIAKQKGLHHPSQVDQDMTKVATSGMHTTIDVAKLVL